MAARSPAPTGLIGRDDELARIRELVTDGARLLTLVGPPGVGKTRLLRHFGRQLGTRRPQAVLVLLGDVKAGEVLASTMTALRLGARPSTRGAAFARLVERMEARDAWLLLDEAEHVREEVRDLVAMVLDETTRSRIVVTSRERLDIAPEHVVNVEPLGSDHGVALLHDALGRAASRWSLDDGEARALVARVDGLPLGIELVASRVAALGARDVLADVRSAGTFSVLEAALDDSFAMLDERARFALAALSVFRDGFSLDAAAAVLGHDADATAAVRALVGASLLRPVASSERPRFGLLTAIRAFAHAKLEATGRHGEIARRHVEAFARPAVVSTDDADAERANRIAAFEYAVAAGDAPAAGRLALDLDPVLVRLGPPDLHGEILRAAIDACTRDGSTKAVLAELLRAHARFLALRGRVTEAVAQTERAVALAEAVGDRRVIAAARSFESFARRAIGDLDGAEAAGRSALGYAHETGDLVLEASTEQSLGLVEHARRRHAEALGAFVRALAAARRAGDDRTAGLALANRAFTLFAMSDYDGARESYDSARVCFEACGDRYHVSRILPIEVALLRTSGELSAAERRFASAVESVRVEADRVGEVELLLEGARIAALRRERARAEVRLAEAKLVARGIEDVALNAEIDDVARLVLRAQRIHLTLTILADGKSVELEGGARGRVKIDLGRRPALRRILLALAERHGQGAGLSPVDARNAGWPGERMRAESASARVYMAIRRLRALGLEEAILTTDEGYALASVIRVVGNC